MAGGLRTEVQGWGGTGSEEGGSPAADKRLWWAEVGRRSEGRLPRGSPAWPSAPGTIALSAQRGAAASPARKARKGGSKWREGQEMRGKRKTGRREARMEGGEGMDVSETDRRRGKVKKGRNKSRKRRRVVNVLRTWRNRAPLQDTHTCYACRRPATRPTTPGLTQSREQ